MYLCGSRKPWAIGKLGVCLFVFIVEPLLHDVLSQLLPV
jgi:hypothetical protein